MLLIIYNKMNKTKDYTRRAVDKYRENLKSNPEYAEKAERAKVRQKEYYQANKERFSERAKAYYERKKKILLQTKPDPYISVDPDFTDAVLKE